MSERPVKVLSVCTSDSSGGAARAAYRIHRAVRDLGVESRMFVKQKGTEDPTVLTVDDFIPHHALYHGFDWVRNKVKNKWQHYRWGKYPDREKYFMSDLRSTDIGGALRKIDYDILHLHWVNLRFLPLEQLPKDKPIVWTLHDSWPFCGVCHLPLECNGYFQACGTCPRLHSTDPDDLSHRIWQRKQKIYDGLDLHIVAPSRWMADCARQSSLFGSRDIRVIPNCIDTKLFSPGDRKEACERLGLDPGRKHILFGAMNALRDPNKGYQYLIKALSSLPPSIREISDLIVFGVEEPIDDRTTGMHTLSLGVIQSEQELVSIYRSADVTVVPSLSENLSCTIMESLSCGTPVAAFKIGGNSDMIEHQANGYLAREKDYDDLAAGILWGLEHTPYENNKVADRFTPERISHLYHTLYQAIKDQ